MKMISQITVALVSTLTIGNILAAAPKTEIFKLDSKASQITWTGTKATGSSHTGNISFKEGTIEATSGDVKGGHFSVEMNTLTDNDLASNPEYQKKLVGHLQSDDFFKVSQFPESTFKITKIEKKAVGEYTVTGDLTMIGTTKPVEFPAKLAIDKNTLTGDAILKLNRTNWGLKYGSKSFFKELVGDKIIKDEFELALKIVAKK